MNYSSSLSLFLLLSSLLLSTSQPLPAPETLLLLPSLRHHHAHLKATTPHLHPSQLPFLLPSTLPHLSYCKYSAFLLRTPTSPTAPNSFGNDFCYVQIQDSENSTPLWESECTPITTANSCSLVFNDEGLAIYDGSNSEWDTGAESADNNPLESLELVDEADMRIRDKIGELAWRASDDPRVNQRCGEPGSPGLGPALPPFAQPIGGKTNLPFGQNINSGAGSGTSGQNGVVQQAADDNGRSGSGGDQGFGFGSEQPLVDNSPYDSGSGRGVEMGVWIMVALLFVYY